MSADIIARCSLRYTLCSFTLGFGQFILRRLCGDGLKLAAFGDFGLYISNFNNKFYDVSVAQQITNEVYLICLLNHSRLPIIANFIEWLRKAFGKCYAHLLYVSNPITVFAC
jgi:hypothetical protein